MRCLKGGGTWSVKSQSHYISALGLEKIYPVLLSLTFLIYKIGPVARASYGCCVVTEMTCTVASMQRGPSSGTAVSLMAVAMALCFCLQVATPDGQGKHRAKWGLLKNIQSALQKRFWRPRRAGTAKQTFVPAQTHMYFSHRASVMQTMSLGPLSGLIRSLYELIKGNAWCRGWLFAHYDETKIQNSQQVSISSGLASGSEFCGVSYTAPPRLLSGEKGTLWSQSPGWALWPWSNQLVVFGQVTDWQGARYLTMQFMSILSSPSC